MGPKKASDADLDNLLDEALDKFETVNEVRDESAASSSAPKGASSAPGGSASAKFDPLKRKPKGKGPAKGTPASAAAAPGGDPPESGQDIDEMARTVAEMLQGLSHTGPKGMGKKDAQAEAAAEFLRRVTAMEGGAGGGARGAGGAGDRAASSAEAGPSGRAAGGPRPPPSEDDLDGLADQFEKLGDMPEMQSLVDGLMQHLLSKDVLYEPMREIGAKFPAWLAKNRGKIPQHEFERFEAQHRYIQDICRHYESNPSDFSTLMRLLQEMQECGQPPEEIVKELAPGMAMGPDGLPVLPPGLGGPMPGAGGAGGQPECAIM